MKSNILKAVASVATATTLLVTSATCFAAEENTVANTANTVTTYSDGAISVKSTVTAAENAMVTYLASTKADGSVETKDDIVYITQWTSDGTAKEVAYTLKSDQAKVNNLSAVVKYGSDMSDVAAELNAADETKTVQVNGVTVTKDNGVESVTGVEYVAIAGQTEIGFTLAEGYMVDTITVNGEVVSVEGNVVVVPYRENPTLDIKTKLTKAPVSAEETADLSKIDADITVYENGEKLPTLGKVVKLANVDETVIEYGIYVENAEGAFKFNEEDTNNGYYPAAVANEDGYFAVNIASNLLTEGGYVAYPYYKTASETVVIGK